MSTHTGFNVSEEERVTVSAADPYRTLGKEASSNLQNGLQHRSVLSQACQDSHEEEVQDISQHTSRLKKRKWG